MLISDLVNLSPENFSTLAEVENVCCRSVVGWFDVLRDGLTDSLGETAGAVREAEARLIAIIEAVRGSELVGDVDWDGLMGEIGWDSVKQCEIFLRVCREAGSLREGNVAGA